MSYFGAPCYLMWVGGQLKSELPVRIGDEVHSFPSGNPVLNDLKPFFEAILELGDPCFIDDITFDQEQVRINIYLNFRKGGTFFPLWYQRLQGPRFDDEKLEAVFVNRKGTHHDPVKRGAVFYLSDGSTSFIASGQIVANDDLADAEKSWQIALRIHPKTTRMPTIRSYPSTETTSRVLPSIYRTFVFKAAGP